MYLIVVGLGGIGRTLAEIAARAGENVVVIDKNEERCAEILENLDLLAITGNANNKDVLIDAGIERADALVATITDDSQNLMVCWLAKKYNVKTIVSIVNQTEHTELFKEIGVRVSENPDEIVARSLYLWAENPETMVLGSIEGGSIFEITVSETAKAVNRKVIDFPGNKDMLYIAIRRMGKLIIPSGNLTFLLDDIIAVFTKKESEEKSLEYMNDNFR